MSASGEIIGRLLASGMSGQAIGKAIGRDRSLVSQVGRGVKPGANLEAALRELERRTIAGESSAGITAPTRRTTSSGRLAGVRRPTTIRGRSYATATVKRQALASGGRSLLHTIEDAAEDGRTVAATISFDRTVTVNNSSGGRAGRAGRGGTLEMKLGDAGRVADEIDQRFGGNVAEYLYAEAAQRGHVSGHADEREGARHVVAVELRSWE